MKVPLANLGARELNLFFFSYSYWMILLYSSYLSLLAKNKPVLYAAGIFTVLCLDVQFFSVLMETHLAGSLV